LNEKKNGIDENSKQKCNEIGVELEKKGIG
jgi:hypothetical protein